MVVVTREFVEDQIKLVITRHSYSIPILQDQQKILRCVWKQINEKQKFKPFQSIATVKLRVDRLYRWYRRELIDS